MTIAIFIYSLTGGGAERVVSYLLPYLKNKGHQVHLVLMSDIIKYELPKDIPVHFIENSNPLEPGLKKWIKLPFLARRYARLLKKLGITHSFSLLSRPNYINVMSRWFTNHPYELIISERNYPSLQYGYGDLQSKMNRFLVRLLYPRADLIISNARASGLDLVENFGCKEDQLSVVYNPIDTHSIDSIKGIENFFNPEFCNLVSVGRLEGVKNHQLLINAVSDFPNVRLYLLGHGPLQKDLEELIENLNLKEQVFLLGFQSNPFKYLKSADILIHGANHEGFPNVLLEAMCCGLPILATNCKSGPDELLDLKVPKTDDIMITDYGILTPVNNLELMKRGLNYMLENPGYRQKVKENMKDRILQYKKDTILELYERTLKRVGS